MFLPPRSKSGEVHLRAGGQRWNVTPSARRDAFSMRWFVVDLELPALQRQQRLPFYLHREGRQRWPTTWRYGRQKNPLQCLDAFFVGFVGDVLFFTSPNLRETKGCRSPPPSDPVFGMVCFWCDLLFQFQAVRDGMEVKVWIEGSTRMLLHVLYHSPMTGSDKHPNTHTHLHPATEKGYYWAWEWLCFIFCSASLPFPTFLCYDLMWGPGQTIIKAGNGFKIKTLFKQTVLMAKGCQTNEKRVYRWYLLTQRKTTF